MKWLFPPKKAAFSAYAPENTRIYAIGDIHGRLDLLQELQKIIENDKKNCALQKICIIYLGDYIDRGYDSRGVVDWLIKHPLNNAKSIYLKGNHEQALLDFMDGRLPYRTWVRWGGDATLASYGLALFDENNAESVERLRREVNKNLPNEHISFYKSLKLLHEEGDYVFVHAGIRPHVALTDQTQDDLLMIREDFLEYPVTGEKTIVHGHTIFPEPQTARGRIGVDTGAYYTDNLTAVVLERDVYRFLQTG